jgi:hypothetical protein
MPAVCTLREEDAGMLLSLEVSREGDLAGVKRD